MFFYRTRRDTGGIQEGYSTDTATVSVLCRFCITTVTVLYLFKVQKGRHTEKTTPRKCPVESGKRDKETRKETYDFNHTVSQKRETHSPDYSLSFRGSHSHEQEELCQNG